MIVLGDGEQHRLIVNVHIVGAEAFLNQKPECLPSLVSTSVVEIGIAIGIAKEQVRSILDQLFHAFERSPFIIDQEGEV